MLDLQRTAGNQLTTGALARWIVALGRLDPVLEVRVSCTAGDRARYAITLQGPAGGASVQATLGAGDAATVSLVLAEAFGDGDAEGGLVLRIAGPGRRDDRGGCPAAVRRAADARARRRAVRRPV